MLKYKKQNLNKHTVSRDLFTKKKNCLERTYADKNKNKKQKADINPNLKPIIPNNFPNLKCLRETTKRTQGKR